MCRDSITLKNMIFYASHGVSKAERELGQRFEIDVTMRLDLESAAAEDRLSGAVDYGSVYNAVEQITTTRVYNLLEALAQAIALHILNRFPVQVIDVVVRKPRVSIRGTLDYVEVSVSRTREDARDH